ncbi:cytochrome c [Dyadobacter luticola]|uniref:Cytochrome c n=1 Tax=Dyadobacter luticola TaxID=1979387 RepID=A0A5R9L3G5_9BACT|nr:cytochrome c [Dyadobacter luticola]TLV02899.1 cytochrome c [Dyadobacter luticola]
MKFLKFRRTPLISQRNATLLSVLIFCGAVALSAFRTTDHLVTIHFKTENKDSIESVKAFMDVYTVLMSPRCMNCHPAGDVPLQGDDSHLHAMGPKRGADGKGVYAMKCMNCHQPTNTPGLHTPPGNPNWHLPPADMKMVFQGKTPHELAKQLVDKSKNGNKDTKQLLEHAHDSLVLAGWDPGEGRTLPPMSHKDFVKAWNTWIKKGAYAPAPTTN